MTDEARRLIEEALDRLATASRLIEWGFPTRSKAGEFDAAWDEQRRITAAAMELESVLGLHDESGVMA